MSHSGAVLLPGQLSSLNVVLGVAVETGNRASESKGDEKAFNMVNRIERTSLRPGDWVCDPCKFQNFARSFSD